MRDYSIAEVLPGLYFIDLKVGGEKELAGAYILASQGEAALIEAGPASSAVGMLAALSELGITPEEVRFILPTHIHIDHAGAAGILARHLPYARVLVHPRVGKHIVDPDAVLWPAATSVLGELAEIYGRPEPVPQARLVFFQEGMEIGLGDLALNVIYTPGHASHHMSIHIKELEVVFSGDAAGCYIPSIDALFPITTPPFRFEQAMNSIARLISISPKWNAFTHFGIFKEAAALYERARRKYALWASSALELEPLGIKSTEGVLEFMAERDEELRRLLLCKDGLRGVMSETMASILGVKEMAWERASQPTP
jgi:glyoxylase-like metal-dependent hydrolase (beta-lactamase superfamily II)